MEIEPKYYNPRVHDRYKCLSVKQPYADLLTKKQGEVQTLRADGTIERVAIVAKTIEVRSRNTNYRGEVLICSSAKPELPGHLSGVTCGLVELYDTKPVSAFTEEDWKNTCIPEGERPTAGYGWLMRNARRVVEMPVKGRLGFYDIIVPKGDLTNYPNIVKL